MTINAIAATKAKETTALNGSPNRALVLGNTNLKKCATFQMKIPMIR